MAKQGIHWGVPAPPSSRRETTPFTWLDAHPEPDLPLTPDALRGVVFLRRTAEEHVPFLVRSLVHLTSRPRTNSDRLGATASALNRRRRAATEWLRSLLAGAVDIATLHQVGEQWLPTLTGHGRDPERYPAEARACIEFVRGALTALVLRHPEDNLVPEARAIYALENVLGRHLAATRHAFERRAPEPLAPISLEPNLPV